MSVNSETKKKISSNFVWIGSIYIYDVTFLDVGMSEANADTP